MKTKQLPLIAFALTVSLIPLPADAASADLKIAITVTPSSPQIGDVIQYHCVVTNQGPDTATSINGYFGPDNSNGGCNPQNPQVSCDKYTNFASSDPAPFFTDPTNFRYVRLKQNGQVVQQLASGESGTFDINYQATANGTVKRQIGVSSPDDSTPANNSQQVTTMIGTSATCNQPPQGLVSWWRGEGNANDYLNVNNGVVQNAVTYPSAKVGQGFGLNGSDQKILIGNPASMQLQNFTIDAWIKRADTGVVSHDPAGPFQLAGILAGGNNGYGFYIAPDGTIGLTRVGVDGVTSPGAKVTDTSFHHVAVSKSGSIVTFYVDGVAATAASYNPGFTFNSFNSNTYIGYFGSGGGEFWGVIDEVHFFSRGLSASEVQAIYTSASAGLCPLNTYDAVRDFNSTLNTASQTWQYGYTDTNGTGFTDYEEPGNGVTYQVWHRTNQASASMSVLFNGMGHPFDYNECTEQPIDVLGLFPGNDGRRSVVRWIAPRSGTYSFQGKFENIDHATSDATIVRTEANSNVENPLIDPIYINVSPSVCHQTVSVVPFTFTIAVNAGDKIDFRVGWGQNNQYSYDGTGFAVTINNVGPPPPSHGGLSATTFQVDLSSSPAYPPAGSPVDGLAGTPLLFTAQENSLAGDVSVRVQATTTPATESSWTDLSDANNGRMTYFSNFQVFALFSLSYPEQNGVYFRAISSAGGYPDSISNVVGPFDLASSSPIIGSTRLDFTGNGSIADLYFRATESATVTGMTVRVQTSTNPNDEGSWSDLANGGMTQSTDPKQFLLLYNNFPTTNNVYFRAIASASGYTDSISNMMGPFNITHVVPPVVTLNPPAGLNSADGHDPKNPILVPYGFYSFGATVNTARSLKSLKFRVDGETRTTFTNGEKQASITTIDSLGSFHVLEAVAVDDQNVTARLGTAPVFIKIVPNPNGSAAKAENGPIPDDASSTHLYHVAVSGGVWTDASTWHDENGNNGVPTRLDSVEIGDNTIYFGLEAEAGSVSISGGNLVGSSGGPQLHIYNNMQMGSCRVIGSLLIFIEKGATCTVIASTNVTFEKNPDQSSGDDFTGTFFVFGTLNIHGSGGMVGMQKMFNQGNLNFISPLQSPPTAAIDPKAVLRPLSADTFTNSGLIASSTAALLTQDGSNLITQDGSNIVSHDGGTVVAAGAGNIVATGAGNIVATGAGNIVATGAGNIVAAGAGNIVAAGAGNVHASRTAAAATPTGYVQTAGETNLSAVTVVGDVTLNGGIVSGTGFIQGKLTNNGGYVAPGHSAGAVAVLGDFAQGANGTTILEMGGAKGGQFDSLQVSGAATLGGKLNLKLINSYQPDVADTSNPIAYKSVTGAFASISSNAQVTMNTTGILATMNSSVPNPPSGQPANISTRMRVLTGDNVLIGGFIITGPNGSTKKVLLRGMGPSLAGAGLSGVLADPLLELHFPNGSTLTNDNWGDASWKDQIPPNFQPNAKESAILVDLAPGAYTFIEKGAHGETGIGLTEVYDFDGKTDVALANISTRGFVDTGDNVMIGGFIVAGTEPAQVLVRATGPSLKNPPSDLTGALEDPMLELHDANGNVISNDNWRATQESDIIATTLAPLDNHESAILATLVPGGYTAIVRGKDNTTGIAVVEAYKIK